MFCICVCLNAQAFLVLLVVIVLPYEELMLLNCGVGEDSWVPWTARRSNQSIPKGNQSWIFTGRTDAEAPIFWPPDAKNWLIGKNPKAGKDWRQEEKGTTEDKMVGWHHWLGGHGFDQALGSLAHCSPCGQKESELTEQLNWTCLGSFSPRWAVPGDTMWSINKSSHWALPKFLNHKTMCDKVVVFKSLSSGVVCSIVIDNWSRILKK